MVSTDDRRSILLNYNNNFAVFESSVVSRRVV